MTDHLPSQSPPTRAELAAIARRHAFVLSTFIGLSDVPVVNGSDFLPPTQGRLVTAASAQMATDAAVGAGLVRRVDGPDSGHRLTSYGQEVVTAFWAESMQRAPIGDRLVFASDALRTALSVEVLTEGGRTAAQADAMAARVAGAVTKRLAAEWIMVPREPTEAMLVNGREALLPIASRETLHTYGPVRGVWSDMIGAAPAWEAPAEVQASGDPAPSEAATDLVDLARRHDLVLHVFSMHPSLEVPAGFALKASAFVHWAQLQRLTAAHAQDAVVAAEAAGVVSKSADGVTLTELGRQAMRAAWSAALNPSTPSPAPVETRDAPRAALPDSAEDDAQADAIEAAADRIDWRLPDVVSGPEDAEAYNRRHDWIMLAHIIEAIEANPPGRYSARQCVELLQTAQEGLIAKVAPARKPSPSQRAASDPILDCVRLKRSQGVYPPDCIVGVIKVIPHGGHTDSPRQYVLCDAKTIVVSDAVEVVPPQDYVLKTPRTPGWYIAAAMRGRGLNDHAAHRIRNSASFLRDIVDGVSPLDEKAARDIAVFVGMPEVARSWLAFQRTYAYWLQRASDARLATSTGKA